MIKNDPRLIKVGDPSPYKKDCNCGKQKKKESYKKMPKFQGGRLK